MKKSDIILGWVYEVKVGGRLVLVRIDSDSDVGGWYGTNLVSGRRVHVQTAGGPKNLIGIELPGEVTTSEETVQ